MQSKLPASKLFRNAIAAGAFFQAEELLECYRHEVEAAWKAAASAAERRTISLEVTAVLEWARLATLVSRSHAQSKLILLNRENAYSPRVSRDELRELSA
jgi:hypothetical protein